MKVAALTPLIASGDPDPVEVVNADSDCPILLVCEHAGTAIPEMLGGLGIEQGVLLSHRGWDIGAERVARRMAKHLGAPLILQHYSRLVIDCNRPPFSSQSIPEISDQATIPGNRSLPPWQRDARVAEIFTPLDRQITAQFEKHRRACAVSVHSFTPRLGDQSRPWHAGFLNRARPEDARALMAHVQTALPKAVLALNQPYQIDEHTDWFIPVHAEPRNIAHCLIEIRNDQIDTDAGATRWARITADAVQALMEAKS